MAPEVIHTTHNREPSLDFLRGLAVFLMIFAHAMYFFSANNNWVINAMARFANMVTFTTFLFVSGATLFVAYLAKTHNPTETASLTKKSLRRSTYLLLGYYLVAIVGIAQSFKGQNLEQIAQSIFKVLTFQTLVPFTEFLIPFIFYGATFFLLAPLYKKLSQKLSLALGASLLLFSLGYILYPLQLSEPLQTLKTLFAGNSGTNSFPILQYYPVVLLGLCWGNYITHHASKTQRDYKAIIYGAISAGIVLLSSLFSHAFPLAILAPQNRWPPSVGFLAIGLTFSFFMIDIFTNLKKRGYFSYFFGGFFYLGKDAYDLFIVHILLLYFYAYLFGQTFQSALVALGCFALLLLLSVLISSLNLKTSPSIFTTHFKLSNKGYKYRPKKRHLIGATLFIAIVFLNVNIIPGSSLYGARVEPDAIIGSNVNPLPAKNDSDNFTQPDTWYNNNYPLYRQITLQNKNYLDPIELDEGLKIKVFLPTAMEQGVQASVDNLALVYYNNDHFVPLKFNATQEDEHGFVIEFNAYKKLYSNEYDNRYFIYYGADATTENHTLSNFVASNSDYGTQLSPVYGNKIQVAINRKWHLTQTPKNTVQNQLILRASLLQKAWIDELATIPQNPTLFYKVEGTNLQDMLAQDNGDYQANIDVSNLSPGDYTVYVYSNTSPDLESQKLTFHVSDPVLVAWSVDWEGWDIPQSFLESLDTQSQRHNYLPLTHFFNPRIYLPSVLSPERASYLTQCVKNRQATYGDEIALHLHMQFDMLQAAGITPKNGPRWGFGSGDGYDVYTTAYSQDEIEKLVIWAKTQFVQNGLNAPTGYRAGGWFANLDVLNVLERQGFSYDSSGREHNLWGGSLVSPWNLTDTTQPYYPSLTDQNQTGPDHFNLLEIPNNGGDAYAYTGEQMRDRFLKNYSGGIAYQKSMVVFLSHPQWQGDDESTMDIPLSTVDQYLFQKDQGPVVYATINQINELWKTP